MTTNIRNATNIINITNAFDIVIIGGGIAGLYCAMRLQQLLAHSRPRILLVEQQNNVGGRIHTIYNTNTNTNTNNKNAITSHSPIMYESGAFRFNNKHKILLNLIKELGLSDYVTEFDTANNHSNPHPHISPKIVNEEYSRKKTYSNNAKKYTKLFNKVIQTLSQVDKNDLINRTFEDACYAVLTHDEIQFLIAGFGYDADFIQQNAWDAIRSFTNDFVNRDNHDAIKYFKLTCGLSQICNRMAKIFVNNGGNILLNTYLKNYHNINSRNYNHYDYNRDNRDNHANYNLTLVNNKLQ